MTIRVEQQGDDVLLWVKAVPGSSRDEIAGVLGDRLKVRVSVPAEGGRANRAICAAIARCLHIKNGSVSVDAGHTNPLKVVRIMDTTCAQVLTALES